MVDLDPKALTWTALLGRWMDYARASLAIPSDAAGERWRGSVPAVISLQAVTFALSEIAELPADERAFARDRAAVMIDDQCGSLEHSWGDELPDSLVEICDDACRALDLARFAGTIELVWPGTNDRPFAVMPEVAIDDESGTLAVMQPGTLIMPGAPVAWWTDRPAPAIETALPGCGIIQPAVPHQVYRVFNEHDRPVRDVVLPITSEPIEGLPLLVPLYDDGRAIGHFMLDPAEWEQQQRDMLAQTTIPLTWDDLSGRQEG